MNKIKEIKKIIGYAVAPYGFSVDFSDRNEGVHFIRERGDLKQIINIQIVHSKFLALKFNTNAYQQRTIDGSEFSPEKKSDFLYPGIPIPAEWWQWNNDAEFIDILNTFKNIILEHGLKALEEISVPSTEIRPTIQADWELYQNHKELNRNYRITLGIENESSTRKVVEKIHEVILKTRNQDFKEVEPMLIGLAAVYGEELIARRGGEWQWREDFDKICWIDKMHEGVGGTYPLNDIIGYWREGMNDIEFFLNKFRVARGENII
jgi:hypothetical protein